MTIPTPDVDPFSTILAALNQLKGNVTDLNASVASMTAARDAVQAQLDAANAAAAPSQWMVNGWSSDPTTATVLVKLTAVGRGSQLERWTLNPMTSGAAKRTVSKSGTNPLYIARIDAKSGMVLGGILIEGTDQGHEYNGVYVTGSGAVDDLTVLGGSSGSGNAPPHECFGVGFNQCVDMVSSDVVSLPGYRTVTGTMIGINNSKRFTAVRHVAHGSTGGTGKAVWQTDDYVDVDGDYSGNRRALNVEQPGGTYELVRVNFGRNDAKGRVMTFNGFRSRATLIIRNPIWDKTDTRPLGISVYPTYNIRDAVTGIVTTKPNLVTAADVHIIENDIDVTNDPRFKIGSIG